MVMSEHSREWWFHESEHVLVVLLLVVVLFQASQVVDTPLSESEPVVIVPATEAFTVPAGQVVTFPWLVVNRLTEPVSVESGIILDWKSADPDEDRPGSVTALIVKPAYAELASIGSGEHRQYRYQFTAPEYPGDYTLTVTAEVEQERVEKDVLMRVVEP